MNQPHTPGLETYLEIPMSPEDPAVLAAIAAGGDGTAGDRMFHASVLAAARNLVLVDLLDSLAEGAGKIAAASLGRPGQPPRSLAAHRLSRLRTPATACPQRHFPIRG